jgi:hypothetical protein
MEMNTTRAVAGSGASTLQVIGAGFGRTGTLSMREALARLGFDPCDHMLENIEHPWRFRLWDEAFRRKQTGEPIDWRPLLQGYRAIVDWPGAYFWRELIAAHPDAKVILTVRDPDRWYESVSNTIHRMRDTDTTPRERALLWLLGLVLPGGRAIRQTVDDIIWQGTFDGRFTDREYALRVFTEHIQEVKDTVPADRLLVFDVREGWGPLCEFLGVPIPVGEPFPHANDSAAFQRQIRERLMQSALQIVRPVVLAAASVAALSWIKRKARTRRQKSGS